jgi:hypothetical protein
MSTDSVSDMEDSNQIRPLLDKILEQNRKLEEKLDWVMETFSDRFDTTDRKILAIETFPKPNIGRPPTFHSATEVHSVSQPIRRRLGHYG